RRRPRGAVERRDRLRLRLGAVVDEQEGPERLADVDREADVGLADLLAGGEEAARDEPVAEPAGRADLIVARLPVARVDELADELELPRRRLAPPRIAGRRDVDRHGHDVTKGMPGPFFSVEQRPSVTSIRS